MVFACSKSDCQHLNKKTGACNYGGPSSIQSGGTCGSFKKIPTASERAIAAHRTIWQAKGSPVTVHLSLYCVDMDPVECGRNAFACHSRPKHFGDEFVLPGMTGKLSDVTCDKCKRSKLYVATAKAESEDAMIPEDMTPYEFKPKAKRSVA